MPKRAFQGWRYFAPKSAPPDIDESQAGLADMPEALRRQLAGLGLFGPDTPLDRLESLALPVAQALQKDGRAWSAPIRAIALRRGGTRSRARLPPP